MISLSDIPAAGAVTEIRQRLPVPLTWVGAGVLAGPLLLGVVGQAGGHLLMEGAALLVFFEMGLRLTDRQSRLVPSAGGRMMQASLPCAAVVFVAAAAGAFAMGATVPQSLFAGLVLLPGSICFPPGTSPLRAAGLLGQGIAGLGGLLLLPLLGHTLLPGWILTLRYVFICIAFISIALVLRHRLVPRRLQAARMGTSSVIGVAAVVLAVVGASAWIGPGLEMSAFIAGLILSKSCWGDHPLFRRLAGLRSWSALLFFTGLGVLAFSPTVLDLLWIVIGMAGGLIFLRASVLFFFTGVRPSPMRTALGPSRAPLGAVAFAVLYAGLEVQVLPDAWAAAAASVLAAVALALAGTKLLEHRPEFTAPPASRSQLPAPSLPLEPDSQEARRALCRGPFLSGGPVPGAPSRLHLMQVAPNAPATRLPLRRLELRRHYGVEIVGCWRHDAYVHAPPSDYSLQAGDHVLLAAAPAQLSRSTPVFRPSSDFH